MNADLPNRLFFLARARAASSGLLCFEGAEPLMGRPRVLNASRSVSRPVFRSLLSALLLLTSLSACGPELLGSVQTRLVVEPEDLDFGKQPVLFSKTLKLELSNQGSALLHFESIRLEGDEAFELGSVPKELGRGASAELEVHFVAPEKAKFEALLIIESNDAELPLVEIPVSGEGSTVSVLAVEPEALDFGRVGENRSVVKVLRLKSKGSAPLNILHLGLSPQSSPAYSLMGSTRLPLELAAEGTSGEDSAEIVLRFAPTAEALETEGELLLQSTDPEQRSLSIPLTAQVNRQPVAVPGDDRNVVPGTLVKLDGSESYDPDGDEPLSYAWSLAQVPAGSEAELEGADSASPVFMVDQPGPYLVQLVVTDSAGLASRAELLTVSAITGQGLEVELVWDHPVADLDLHFSAPGVELHDPEDCNGWECEPSFGDEGLTHSGDILAGYGPESVFWEDPPDGSYLIRVHYASAMGSSQLKVRATLRIHRFGIVIRELSHVFDRPDATWTVGTLKWPSGEVRQ